MDINLLSKTIPGLLLDSFDKKDLFILEIFEADVIKKLSGSSFTNKGFSIDIFVIISIPSFV